MRDELWFPQVIWNSTIDDLDKDNLKSYVYQKVEEEKSIVRKTKPTMA